VLVLNFFLFRILPGDPERTLTRLQRVSPSTIDEVKKELGLDRPLTVQFFDYLGDTARGELGISYVFSRPVSEVIGNALWPTILLVGVATIGATVIGTLIGIWGGWRRGSAMDTTSLGFGLVTYAMPEFWLGMLLILVFAVALDWFPTSFMSTPGLTDAAAAPCDGRAGFRRSGRRRASSSATGWGLRDWRSSLCSSSWHCSLTFSPQKHASR
jgi:peptide/nickel transport system permease protein